MHALVVMYCGQDRRRGTPQEKLGQSNLTNVGEYLGKILCATRNARLPCSPPCSPLATPNRLKLKYPDANVSIYEQNNPIDYGFSSDVTISVDQGDDVKLIDFKIGCPGYESSNAETRLCLKIHHSLCIREALDRAAGGDNREVMLMVWNCAVVPRP